MPYYFWVQVETKTQHTFCSDLGRGAHRVKNNLFAFLFRLPVQLFQDILVKLQTNLTHFDCNERRWAVFSFMTFSEGE